MSEIPGPRVLSETLSLQHLPNVPPQAGSHLQNVSRAHGAKTGLTQSRPTPPQPDTQGWGSPWGHGGHGQSPSPKVGRAGPTRGVGESTARPHTKDLQPRLRPGWRWALGAGQVPSLCFANFTRPFIEAKRLRQTSADEGRYEHALEHHSAVTGEGALPTRGHGWTSKSPAAAGGRTNRPCAPFP